MPVDVVTAEVLLWAVLAASWLVVIAPAAAAGAALAAWWQWARPGGIRDQRTAVARLAGRVADLELNGGPVAHRLSVREFDAQLVAVVDRHAAQQAHARAEQLGRDLVALQHQLVAATDRLAVMDLDRRTNWTETDPR